jgi:predicted RNase H-like HicB family nuclease
MSPLILPVIVEADADGYFVYCPSLQGCYSQGDSYEEAVENIRDAIKARRVTLSLILVCIL